MTQPSVEHSTTVRGMALRAADSPARHRQKLARIALDEMVQFVALLDEHGTLLEVNRAALEGAGLKLPDVQGQPFWDCFWWAVSPDIRQALQAAIARAAQGTFIRYDVEIYGRSGGRDTIVIDFSITPVKDDAGQVVFMVAEGRDITEKKAYEQEIAGKNADLHTLLARIRELDKIKTEFFANVSHELRTPLALIIGSAERLQKAGAALPDASAASADVIVRNARMLLKHVNDLLDISKLEAGKLRLELRECDVAALLRRVASHFEGAALERRIDFRLKAPASQVCAVDPEKLQRIVMNLLSNAFKFVPAGGTVGCLLEARQDRLVLSVEDSGPGVEPALRQAIFERFRQGDGAANREFAGTGLGLAIALEFAQMHQGGIEALDSRLGGARFVVTLPARQTAGADASQAALDEPTLGNSTLAGLIEELRLPRQRSASDRADGARGADGATDGTDGMADSATVPARPKILVVEDNPDMNRFIAQCLAPEYRVITAHDGQEGLEKALAHDPALIVSDLMMPRVSGEQMIMALREHPQMADTPILLLSAKADDELKCRLLEDAAQDFITKPFAERELLVRVRNLVAVRRSREALEAAEHGKRQAIEAANRQLEARSAHLTGLFRQAPGFMALLRGPEHVFEFVNAAYLRLIGHREVVGKPVLEALPEMAGQPFLALLDRVLATGEPHVGSAAPVLLQTVPGAPPEQRFVDFVYQPFIEADGRVTGIFVEGQDVTARQHAEDELRRADRRKDEFLATLAHELRNPLAPIRVAAAINRQAGATPAQLKWSNQVIERQVGHMARLLDDLLDISRITRGTIELRRAPLPLAEHLRAVVETVRPLFEARSHRLALHLPAEDVRVDADPVRFAQIFSNLLMNSVKYTDPGGVMEVRAEVSGGMAMVTVADNGIGIAPEVLPRLFEMFAQATSALERSEGGLGIGLSLVRGLVALHGGSIEAHSRGAGQGSQFIVRLPLAAMV